MKPGPLSCCECGAQIWGVPPDLELNHVLKRKDGAPVFSVHMNAECDNKHQLSVRLFPDKKPEVKLQPERRGVKK